MRTGLSQPDVFYFGNAPGETGDSASDALVNGTDFNRARANARSFLNPAAVDDAFDHNKDRLVDATDLAIARDNGSTAAGALVLLDLTQPSPGNVDSIGGTADVDVLPMETNVADRGPGRGVAPSGSRDDTAAEDGTTAQGVGESDRWALRRLAGRRRPSDAAVDSVLDLEAFSRRRLRRRQ